MKQLHTLHQFGPKKCPIYLHLPWLVSVSTWFENQVKSAVKQCFSIVVEPHVVYPTNELLFATNKDVLSALHKSNGIYQFSYTVKPHLHKRLLCNAIRRFPMRENLSRRVVTHSRQDSLAAIAFGKNRCHVSNTCDLWCQLYFARLDTRIVLTRDHLHEVDFNVSAVPGQR